MRNQAAPRRRPTTGLWRERELADREGHTRYVHLMQCHVIVALGRDHGSTPLKQAPITTGGVPQQARAGQRLERLKEGGDQG